jgi:hypothetical protein
MTNTSAVIGNHTLAALINRNPFFKLGIINLKARNSLFSLT